MNSEGWSPTGPRASHRRAPFTSRPTAGTSTSASITAATRNSAGAARCQTRIGSWNANMPAMTAKTRNTACRTRKYVGRPPVNALASAIAIDAEYTITRPKPSSSTAAHSSPASYSGACGRPTLMTAAMGHPFHRSAEHLAAVSVVAEHVEARARGRKQHGVAGPRLGCRGADRVGHAARAQDPQTGPRERLLDERGVAPDQHHGARRARERLAQRSEVLSLAVAARDQDELRVLVRETRDRRDRGA